MKLVQSHRQDVEKHHQGVEAGFVRWYLSAALVRRAAIPAALALAALVSGCGGGQRQDANEPSGNYKIQVVQATFPQKQSLSKRSDLVITVKNVDTKTIPNIAVTVNSFDVVKKNPALADPRRPQFVVNTGPRGGDTAYVGTSALGPLRPGETKTFRWDVTAVMPGKYSLKYAVAAGLNGKAKAILASGATPHGEFRGVVSSKAPEAHVADDGHTVVTSDG